MKREAAEFLISPAGREAAAEVQSKGNDPLVAASLLRREYPGMPQEFRSAVLELVRTRSRAARKFGNSDAMFFTAEALEQSSGQRIAEHRALRFRGRGDVIDACCGIGGDAIALARVVERLTCVDIDPARLLFCEENLRVYGVSARFVTADVMDLRGRMGGYDALFIDPSRRPGGRRTLDVLAMEPPLDAVEALLGTVSRGAVKLPTSVRPEDFSIPGELEWVSVEDGLKEATFWSGDFRTCAASVSLLHRGAFLRDTDLPPEEPEIGESGGYLHEPDPALIRSGLLGRKAASLGMRLLDRDIAYTFTVGPVSDPFFDSYRVLEAMPFNLKRLAATLNAMNAGRVTIKKRGFPLLPEEVARKLKLKGSGSATVVLTRKGGDHLAFIVEPVK